MSVFDSSENLRGQSFAHGLSPLNPTSTDSEEFVESDKMSVFVDEDGVVNVDGEMLLYQDKDPLNSVNEPTFSKDNQLIKGLGKALPSVPEGGIILYTTGGRANLLNFITPPSDKTPTLPEGFALCDGRIYTKPDGGSWTAPNLSQLGVGGAVYIIRLPEGVRATRRRVPAFGFSSFFGSLSS